MNIEEHYPREFAILRENGKLTGEWSNVYDHCKLEGEIAELLSKELCLSEQDTHDLVSAAILHDWFKKVEKTTENYDTTYSYTGLRDLGISERVCDVAHSVGHSTLIWIKEADKLRRVMHFIDDIVLNTTVVPIRERVEGVRANGKCTKLEEEFRSQLGGRSFFDVQVEVGEYIQSDIERWINDAQLTHREPNTLIEWIKSHI